MSIDRAATVRQAEKLLRQGKLDQAIAEYLRLVDDQPRDWNIANLLGDLYLRAGQVDQAVDQFARVAQSLCDEGFVARASALYKKILKLQPDSDLALIRAGELAAQQGLPADARALFATAASGRRQRGDQRGELDIIVRLAALDAADVPARLAGARARVELGDTPGALHDYTSLATFLIEQGRGEDAVVPLRALLELDPGSAAAARDFVRILIAAGRFDEAAPYLTRDTVATDPALLRLTAQLRFDQGDVAAGLELVDCLLIGHDDAPAAVAEMAESLAARRPDSAWLLTERLVGANVERSDWTGAVVALRRFIAQVPHHVPALTRLLDVCVDGGLDDEVLSAQALLADAYLSVGAAVEARGVVEDLLTRQPLDPAHHARMRAALRAEGHADPDRALADWLARSRDLGTAVPSLRDRPGSWDHHHPSAQDDTARALPRGMAEAQRAPALMDGRNPHAIDIELILGTPAPAPPAAVEEKSSVVPERAGTAAADLESVFAAMRDEASHRPLEEAADMAFTRGAAMVGAGELADCIEPLRLAARAPRRRFAAATMLARVYEGQQRRQEAIEWLGHAVDAPGLSDTDRFETLLRMADLLEQTGEPASALAVCLELQADAGNYKDLSVRIARLSRAQAGG